MASEAKPYNPEVFQAVRESYSPGEEHRIYETDVTLMDLFAACAMNGLYASGTVEKFTHTYDKVAHTAYEMAEAMLAEREKRLDITPQPQR